MSVVCAAVAILSLFPPPLHPLTPHTHFSWPAALHILRVAPRVKTDGLEHRQL